MANGREIARLRCGLCGRPRNARVGRMRARPHIPPHPTAPDEIASAPFGDQREAEGDPRACRQENAVAVVIGSKLPARVVPAIRKLTPRAPTSCAHPVLRVAPQSVVRAVNCQTWTVRKTTRPAVTLPARSKGERSCSCTHVGSAELVSHGKRPCSLGNARRARYARLRVQRSPCLRVRKASDPARVPTWVRPSWCCPRFGRLHCCMHVCHENA